MRRRCCHLLTWIGDPCPAAGHCPPTNLHRQHHSHVPPAHPGTRKSRCHLHVLVIRVKSAHGKGSSQDGTPNGSHACEETRTDLDLGQDERPQRVVESLASFPRLVEGAWRLLLLLLACWDFEGPMECAALWTCRRRPLHLLAVGRGERGGQVLLCWTLGHGQRYRAPKGQLPRGTAT